MSSSSSSRANRIDIAGESRPCTSTAIATPAPTVARISATTAVACRIEAEESIGSVGSRGATFIAVNPASVMRRALSAYSSGRFTAGTVRVEADPVAARTAQQRIDGHARNFAGDVPERLLDAADRGHEHRAAAPERMPVHDLPEVLYPSRVLARTRRRAPRRPRRSSPPCPRASPRPARARLRPCGRARRPSCAFLRRRLPCRSR